MAERISHVWFYYDNDGNMTRYEFGSALSKDHATDRIIRLIGSGKELPEGASVRGSERAATKSKADAQP